MSAAVAGSREVQLGPAASAPDEPAIRHHDGELSKYQTRRVLLPTGQGLEGGPSAAVDRVGDSARTPVAAQSQLVTLTAFPGSGHGLRHQRQRAAAYPACGPCTQLRDHRLNQSGFHGEAASAAGPVIASRNSASLIGPTVNKPASITVRNAG